MFADGAAIGGNVLAVVHDDDSRSLEHLAAEGEFLMHAAGLVHEPHPHQIGHAPCRHQTGHDPRGDDLDMIANAQDRLDNGVQVVQRGSYKNHAPKQNDGGQTSGQGDESAQTLGHIAQLLLVHGRIALEYAGETQADDVDHEHDGHRRDNDGHAVRYPRKLEFDGAVRQLGGFDDPVAHSGDGDGELHQDDPDGEKRHEVLFFPVGKRQAQTAQSLGGLAGVGVLGAFFIVHSRSAPPLVAKSGRPRRRRPGRAGLPRRDAGA
ncbi:hypothetical protein [Solidesulfovibrio carbinolicus]|uniref:hypothetical protein n=1 Tax=Solidesulfovibrio carbinolicus TaxID=296842 RepID=UPI0013EDFA60|nr:hypothetical protein [Solidesulfovibrio carbinolicus]